MIDNNSEFYFSKFNNESTGYLKVNFGNSQKDIKDEKKNRIGNDLLAKKFHRNKDTYFLTNL